MTTGEDWFHLFQSGSSDAFRQVFQLYYRPVAYFAAKILRDDTHSEDIVSETFQKAWDRRGQFTNAKHLENFMYLVTRNACISHLRHGKVQRTTIQEWVRLSEEWDPGNSALDLEHLQTKLMASILDKLDQLPGGEVLRMAYLEGKSTKEIAVELNTTENNVYIIKSRTLKLLRSMLSKGEWLFFVLLFIRL